MRQTSKIRAKKIFDMVDIRVTVFVIMMAVMWGVGLIFYTPIENYINGVTPLAGDYKVHFVDVGHGDAIIVEAGEDIVMIDSGDKNSTLNNYIAHAFCDGFDVDYLILTHVDADHIGNAYNLLKYHRIKNLYIPMGGEGNYELNRVVTLAESIGVDVKYNFVGEKIIGEGYRFEFLSPKQTAYTEANDFSPIIRAVVNGTSFLFTGDASTTAENEVLADDISVDVLKVGHHGSATSSGLEFLERVRPTYAVISAEEGVYSNLPSVEVVGRLEAVGVSSSNILRTDKLNSIVFVLGEEVDIFSSDYADRVFIKYYYILITVAILMYCVIFKAVKT